MRDACVYLLKLWIKDFYLCICLYPLPGFPVLQFGMGHCVALCSPLSGGKLARSPKHKSTNGGKAGCDGEGGGERVKLLIRAVLVCNVRKQTVACPGVCHLFQWDL